MGKEKPIIQQIKERKWKWIGHSFRKDLQAIDRFSKLEPSGTT
jgi:hypothetical protein